MGLCKLRRSWYSASSQMKVLAPRRNVCLWFLWQLAKYHDILRLVFPVIRALLLLIGDILYNLHSRLYPLLPTHHLQVSTHKSSRSWCAGPRSKHFLTVYRLVHSSRLVPLVKQLSFVIGLSRMMRRIRLRRSSRVSLSVLLNILLHLHSARSSINITRVQP